MAGHLLECGAQVTGGYFADPGFKNVPRMADIGYPIAEISSGGEIIITKPPGTGGRVDRLTVTEQLLYEIHDPSAYLAPDVILDLTEVTKKLFYGEDGSFHDRAAAFMKHVPLGRPAEPSEIAQGALFLASAASNYVNGHCLTIDGGWTAGYMM